MEKKLDELANMSLEKGTIGHDDVKWILSLPDSSMLPLLYAAYKIRSRYFGNRVKIHIIDNVQSGGCTEDCHYCGQSRNMKDSPSHQMKGEKEIMDGARAAFEAGAYRHCMVFSGRDLGGDRLEKICDAVKKIKQKFKMELCVSAGFLSNAEAEALKSSGLDRYNHNLNTSSENYRNICTSHDYRKRVDTIKIAKSAGLGVCSGLIFGLGETADDLVSIIGDLKSVKADSVPVNFFMPVSGHKIKNPAELTPFYCLKILALFRFAMPDTEIRAAGGREYHLRGLSALCLYAVDSIFSNGYLTVGGESLDATKQMIKDSGFIVEGIHEFIKI